MGWARGRLRRVGPKRVCVDGRCITLSMQGGCPTWPASRSAVRFAMVDTYNELVVLELWKTRDNNNTDGACRVVLSLDHSSE